MVARICACGSIYLRPGPRCDDCESVHQHRRNSRRAATTYTSTERTRMANAVSQWRSENGDWCPGYQRSPHVASDLTADHVVPVALGGAGGALTVLCRSCNSRKRDNV